MPAQLLSAIFFFSLMNHVHTSVPRQGAASACSDWVSKLSAAIKLTWQAQDDPPVHVSSAFPLPSPHPLWRVTGVLTRKASFGQLKIESRHCIHANSRNEAEDEAKARMQASHPDFMIANLTVLPTSES
ncbi:hypothetical protein [Prosthecobacter dejongeii]|uniref:Uncharacterized protein n=1 Tax=Prosthecobacter dejongeii TaxID=48465 RepID=A0A7W8DNC8_9BACT|nr:hypothetical protein [Prosthecobacter dejongeii]MBB5035960.1 hypothetical protein [Prosthecobacter dejongeii]